jgi:hypothetical protein
VTGLWHSHATVTIRQGMGAGWHQEPHRTVVLLPASCSAYPGARLVPALDKVPLGTLRLCVPASKVISEA